MNSLSTYGRQFLMVVAGVSVLSLAACAPAETFSSGSRVELYNSIEELAADSTLVADIVVTSHKEYPETDSASPYTASTAEIKAVFRPAGLPEDATPTEKFGPGETIVIRQLATGNSVSEDGKKIIIGTSGSYLVFLVGSGVPGASGNEFYITGGTAGLFGASGEEYQWLGNEGDKLPSSLSPADLR
jgi:hypothetical protein